MLPLSDLLLCEVAVEAPVRLRVGIGVSIQRIVVVHGRRGGGVPVVCSLTGVDAADDVD